MMKNKKAKIIIAIIALIVVAVAGIMLARNFNLEKETDKVETTSASTTEKAPGETTETEETTYTASKEIIDEAISAYKKELSKYDLISEAYVADINGDKIPEVFCRTEGIWTEFMMTYTEKAGLSVVEIERHSSTHPEIFISDCNLVYSYDKGHNVGTAFYRSAHIYEIGESGFVEKKEIIGGEPEDIDFNDIEEVSRVSEEYELLFQEDIENATNNIVFRLFSEEAISENPHDYLNEKLS